MTLKLTQQQTRLLTKTVIFLLVPALIAGAVFYYFHLSKEWDNPPSQMLGNEGDIVYQGNDIHVSVSCNCPTVLVESVARTVPIELKLKKQLFRNLSGFKGVVQDRIYLALEAGNSAIDPQKIILTTGQELLRGVEVTQTFNLKITPNDTTLSQITFHFFSLESSGAPEESLGAVPWAITSKPRFATVVLPFIYSSAVFICVVAVFFWSDRRFRALRERTERRLADAKSKAEENPERVRYAWEVARVKLEAYFDRNLLQVNQVFWVAVLVMLIGFGFVLAGVVLSFNQPKVTPTSLVAAVSGIITQFIGATFMVIYRSTMAQANEFMIVLDRINSVGMAVQVLDSIPDNEGQLKNATRAQIVELLLDGNQRTRKTVPSATSKKRPGTKGAGRAVVESVE
jgi:hypothetical protein